MLKLRGMASGLDVAVQQLAADDINLKVLSTMEDGNVAMAQAINEAGDRKDAAKLTVLDMLTTIDDINGGEAPPMTTHERELHKLQQEVAGLEVESKKKDIELERAMKGIHAAAQKVATLDSGLQEMAKTNIVLTADLESARVKEEAMNKDFEKLKVESEKKDAKIAELQVEVSQKDVEVSCATNDMATAAQRVVTLDTELKQMGEINSNLAADLAHVTEEWETLQTDILEQKR
jgi:chromosome segregation ATPase